LQQSNLSFGKQGKVFLTDFSAAPAATIRVPWSRTLVVDMLERGRMSLVSKGFIYNNTNTMAKDLLRGLVKHYRAHYTEFQWNPQQLKEWSTPISDLNAIACKAQFHA
jgi:hypothetical protein